MLNNPRGFLTKTKLPELNFLDSFHEKKLGGGLKAKKIIMITNQNHNNTNVLKSTPGGPGTKRIGI